MHLPDYLPDLSTAAAAVLGFVAAFFRSIWSIVSAPFGGLIWRVRLVWNARTLHDALAALVAEAQASGLTLSSAAISAQALIARLGGAATITTAKPAEQKRQTPRPSRRMKREAAKPESTGETAANGTSDAAQPA